MNDISILKQLRDGLVVSCQAQPGEPLHEPDIMVAMAKTAIAAGAVGIRANGPADIRAIHTAIQVPLIGLYKIDLQGYAVRITPTLKSAQEISAAGADLVALDATFRPHPDNLTAAELIQQVHATCSRLVLADIATFDEGLAAQDAGAEAVSTTLSGYTADSPSQEDPDFDLIEKLARRLSIPVIAEGRITTPSQARHALELGAYAVVVGTAITRPGWITEQFVRGITSR
ncbi:MAG: N-acetylmannosamine-6-phosphate 2-epimerase [Chloroflexota bacterium]|nr:MAG: N-acetylmannosamine-6-phosphate 2-epimerase [Chloroflexota bacterium]